MEQDNSNIQNVDTDKPENKKSKTPALLCTLFGVLATAGIGFGIYGMFFQPKPTCEYADQTTTTTSGDNGGTVTTVSVAEIQNILKNNYGLEEKATTFSESLHMYLDNFDSDAKIIQLIGLSKDILGEETCDYSAMTCSRTIGYDTFNAQYHRLFGNSVDLEKNNYDLKGKGIGLVGMNYDSDQNSFTVVEKTGIGGYSPRKVFTKVISTAPTSGGVKAIVEAVTVNTEPKDQYMSAGGDGNGNNYYYVNMSEEDQNEIYDSMKVYEFDFIKEDDGYKLTTIKKL